MILYFIDKQLNILGLASTNLPEGFVILADNKEEDVDTGVASFTFTFGYQLTDRKKVDDITEVGGYILRKNGAENELYTILDREIDTKAQEVYVYAEDAGLDLINGIVGAFSASSAQPISYYINTFTAGSGFEIGINEVSHLSRKLSWDGEATITERLASVANSFDGCEISYTFDIEGLRVKKAKINIYKKRGQDTGVQLRLNKEVDRIIVKETIANLATGLEVTGGTPEGSETAITLAGYTYDDGDFYVSGTKLLSRKAQAKWGRLPIGTVDHIIKAYSYDTTSQSELCNRSISKLKGICDKEVNYEADINILPENVKVGDRVNIIDDAGELYFETRLLKLQSSVTSKSQVATLGEHLIKESGISAKVEELAQQFAQNTVSVKNAVVVANNAMTKAEEAEELANDALTESENAKDLADAAQLEAEQATQSATTATQKAQELAAQVEVVEESVASIEQTVENANLAAQQAHQAATTATEKAEEAKQQAANAETNATEAKTQAQNADTKAGQAITKSNEAIDKAGQAEETAENATATAQAAQLDAEKAKEDVETFKGELETLENTMSAEYARKTELTETQANLQTQITQNAAQIEQTAQEVLVIDETANNASELANQAKQEALEAQNKADDATADAVAAQLAANEAQAAAQNAQSNANTAKAAADTAKEVADQAQADLEAAQADLLTVQGRVDATEEDIAAAEAKVLECETAAAQAQADAEDAITKATTAQGVANQAATKATEAQEKADDAVSKAALAQQVANEAKGDATDAIETANQAAQTAATAQQIANTAKTNAETAQGVANQAKADAEAAQQAADDADAKAQQAKTDLATAEANLLAVTNRVDATEQEVAEAQAAVVTAQNKANEAAQAAQTAQNTANTAKANAQTAQEAADEAQTAADNAQTAADNAQTAANQAQAAVDALAVRVTTAETSITQNSNDIKLLAKKTEVETLLSGYYTKTETEGLIDVNASSILQQVSATYTTKDDFNNLEIGGRNLLLDSAVEKTGKATVYRPLLSNYGVEMTTPVGTVVTISFDIKSDIDSAKYQFYLTDTAYYTITSIISKTATTEYTRVTATFTRFTATASAATNIPKWLTIRWNSAVSGYNADATFSIRNVKVEIGNRATDWTPAPEDMATVEELNDTTADLTTQIARVLTTSEEILLETLKSYAKTGDFETYKTEVSSQLKLLAEQLTIKFTEATEKISGVDADLQEKFNTVATFFHFDIDGLTIGKSNSPFKVFIDDNDFKMLVNGVDALTLTPEGVSVIPELRVETKAEFLGIVDLLGFIIERDELGNVNCSPAERSDS